MAATLGNLGGHWLMMVGILLGEGDADRGLEGALVGAGLAVTAAVVVIAAVATGRDAASGVAAAAVGGVVVAVVWVLQEHTIPLPALTGGVAVAAALAVGRRPQHLLWVRLMMAGVIFGYVWWATDFSAAFAIMIAPVLPYPTVGISDFASDREAVRRSRTGYAAGR